MHIAIIRQHFSRAHGGAERYAVGLARGLLALGHRISVVCVDADPADAEGIEIVRTSKGKWAGPWRHAAFAKQAGKRAQSLSADLVIALARAYPADVFRLGDPPHHTWMRLRMPNPRKRKRMEKMPRHAALLGVESHMLSPGVVGRYITNSMMVKRQIVHAYGVEPDRVEVFRNPVDPERFNTKLELEGSEVRTQLGIAADELVVFFSGMGFERKGLVPAAKAFALLASQSPNLREKLRFLVVGKGDPSPAKKILAAEGCEHRMIALPPVSDIQRYYAASNVFVLPTLYDPSANAVTESLACGTPVVTTMLNGAGEMIRDGVNGKVIGSREDTEAWANAIAELLSTERIQRSRAYVAMGRLVPTWEDHLKGWTALVNEIAERKRKAKLTLVPKPLELESARAKDGILFLTNESIQARELMRELELEPPFRCLDPHKENVVQADLSGRFGEVKLLHKKRSTPGPKHGAAIFARSHKPPVVARYHVANSRPSRDHLLEAKTPQYCFLKAWKDSDDAALNEFETCQYALKHGVEVTLPLSAGQKGSRSYFLGAEPPGVTLTDFLRRYGGGETEQQRRAAEFAMYSVAEALGKLHKIGVLHGNLQAANTWVTLDLAHGFRAVFSELSHAQRVSRVTHAQMVAELATLHASLPERLANRALRLRFLRRYLWTLEVRVDRRELVHDVLKAAKLWYGEAPLVEKPKRSRKSRKPDDPPIDAERTADIIAAALRAAQSKDSRSGLVAEPPKRKPPEKDAPDLSGGREWLA